MAEATTRPVGEKTDEAPTWSNAHAEHDRHGRPTGARWVRCRDCGVEVPVTVRDDGAVVLEPTGGRRE